MKKYILFLVLFCCFQPLIGQESAYYYGFDDKIDIKRSPDELIVKFNDKIKNEEAKSILATVTNAKIIESIGEKWYVLSCDNNERTKESLSCLASVDYAYVAYVDKGVIPYKLYPTNKILVKYKDHVSKARQRKIEQSYHLQFSKNTVIYTMYEIADGANPLAVANRLQESGEVVFSYPDFMVFAQYFDYTPTDPLYSQQWNFHNTGQLTANDLGLGGTAGADIKMPGAWDITRGDESIIVAVIDGGVTSNHPDLPNTRQLRLLGSNLGAPYDGTDVDDPSPLDDEDGHGNACAGLVGASHNDEGIAGIAPYCKIMPIRLGHGIPLSVFADAVEFAYTNEADVISMSFGIPFSASMVVALENAVTTGRDSKGCVVTISASNSRRSTIVYSIDGGPPIFANDGFIAFPANVEIDGVLTVGASNRYDKQASYSPNGRLDEAYKRLDVVAPSHNFYAQENLSIGGYHYLFGKLGEAGEIYTIDMPGVAGYNPYKIVGPYPVLGEILPSSGTNHQSYTARFGGTSAAAPQVAGVAALLLSVAPCLTQQEVFDLITGAADNVGGYDYTWDGLGRSKEFGFGRLNAKEALLDLLDATAVLGDYTLPAGVTTWDSPITIVGNIHIPDGATLKINNTLIKFTKDAGVTVGRGGRMFVNNATLTSGEGACEAEGFWKGIQVWGTTTEQHFFGSSTNGYLRVYAGSVIENAQNAVRVYRENDEGDVNWNYNGGVVITNNATFRNNWRDVAFLSYHNGTLTSELGNLSAFVNTRFITDGYLLNGVAPAVHVTMFNVEGIPFSGCKFANLTPFLYPDEEDRGKGIISIGAGYKVKPRCTIITGDCPTEYLQRCEFENLEGGIQADAASSMNTILVDRAIFNNVQQGIILNSVDYATIVRNDFIIPATPTGGFGALGIYLNQSTGYEIEENTFTGPGVSSGEIAYGTVIINSGSTANQIYNNDFSAIRVGSLIMGNNRGLFSGLVMKCNNYSNCIYDIGVTFNGKIAEHQGSGFSISSPAGNTFTHNCGDMNDNDFFAQLAIGGIFYWTHNDIPPICFTTPIITATLSGYIYSGNEENACASKVSLDEFSSGGIVSVIAKFQHLAHLAQIEIDNLDNAIDEGDKEVLLNAIANDLASGQLVSMLTSASPLSDEVLIATIQDKPTPLPSNKLMQIMIQNAPITDVVMQALLNRNPPLSSNNMAQINAAQVGVSTREEIESEIAYWKSENVLAYNDAIRSALNETEIGAMTSQLSQTFDMRNAENDPYLKAQAVIRNGDFTNAAIILNGQQSSNTQNDMLHYTQLLLDVAQYPEYIYHCTPQQEEALLLIANGSDVSVSVKAQAILKEVFGEDLILPLYPPTPSQNQQQNQGVAIENTFSTTKIMVYPNPVVDEIAIEFVFKGFAECQIFDVFGRLIKTTALDVNQPKHIITFDGVIQGVYFYHIINNGKTVKSGSLFKE